MRRSIRAKQKQNRKHEKKKEFSRRKRKRDLKQQDREKGKLALKRKKETLKQKRIAARLVRKVKREKVCVVKIQPTEERVVILPLNSATLFLIFAATHGVPYMRKQQSPAQRNLTENQEYKAPHSAKISWLVSEYKRLSLQPELAVQCPAILLLNMALTNEDTYMACVDSRTTLNGIMTLQSCRKLFELQKLVLCRNKFKLRSRTNGLQTFTRARTMHHITSDNWDAVRLLYADKKGHLLINLSLHDIRCLLCDWKNFNVQQRSGENIK